MNFHGVEVPDEPIWEIGKHDWREGNHCLICGLVRALDDYNLVVLGRAIDLNNPELIYFVDGFWQPAPVSCVARLSAQIVGLHTTKEASNRLGITPHAFARQARMRGMFPAAVLRKDNVYLWRESQIASFESSTGDAMVKYSKPNLKVVR